MKTASTNGTIYPQKYLAEQSGFSMPFPDAYDHNGLHVHHDVVRSAASNISRTENIIIKENIMNVKRKCKESSDGLTEKTPAKKNSSGAGKDVHHSSKGDRIILKSNATSRSEAALNAAVEINKKRKNEMKREKGKQSVQESAKNLKICREQEFKKLQADAERLSQETAILTNELRRISEECANLTEENDSLMDDMEETYGHDAISDLKAMKPGGCSKDRSLQISSD